MSPVVHRLAAAAAAAPWEPGLRLHVGHMALFLLSAVFFSCPVPERFLPGRCDFLGQGHQIFHVPLALCCSLCQLAALLADYARRREAVLRDFGEEEVWRACVLHPAARRRLPPRRGARRPTQTQTAAEPTAEGGVREEAEGAGELSLA
ncbi:unnamed protein product [Merluccius merluccius]